jgi:two-component system alkaline phosphatase synthesis response regulator PhoP
MATILIVDDEEDLQMLLELALTRAGYEVYISPNGVDALYQVQYYKPDLILLDLMMPWASGDAVLGFVRSTEELEHTRVLVLSAHATGDQIAEQLKADAYIRKPAEMKEIIRTIKELLGEID